MTENHPHLRPFWNMKANRARTRMGYLRLLWALRRILRRSGGRPPVIGLIECGGNWRVVERIARRRGYRIITGVGDEGSSSALLVRRDVTLIDSGVIRTRAVWVGPKGKKHDGRGFPWATYKLDGRVRTTVVVHVPWDPAGRNEQAWHACRDALIRFASKRLGFLELEGDWNLSARSEEIRRLAQQLGGRVIHTGDALMFAIVRQAKVAQLDRVIHVTGDAKTREGSDHPYAVLRDVA